MALQQPCMSIPNSLALIFLQSANLYVCISLQYLIDSVLTWELLQGWHLILQFYCELIILPNFLLLSALIQDYGSTMALKSTFVPLPGDIDCAWMRSFGIKTIVIFCLLVVQYWALNCIVSWMFSKELQFWLHCLEVA